MGAHLGADVRLDVFDDEAVQRLGDILRVLAPHVTRHREANEAVVPLRAAEAEVFSCTAAGGGRRHPIDKEEDAIQIGPLHVPRATVHQVALGDKPVLRTRRIATRWQSDRNPMAIRWQSDRNPMAIRSQPDGNQVQSPAPLAKAHRVDGGLAIKCNKWQSSAIKCNHLPHSPRLIELTAASPSSAIKCNQVQSSAITCPTRRGSSS